MRIGILTFHKAINYGAYLQAFSLSSKLREQFLSDEVEIIDYEKQHFHRTWNRRNIRNCGKRRT